MVSSSVPTRMKTPVLSFTLSGNKYIWTTRSTDHHTSINMHILMENITFTLFFHFSYLLFHNMFHSYHISYTFYVIFHFTSCSCNCILSSHSSAMLLISFICFTYTYHFLLCFMPVKTLEADTRNNCMYSKVLSLYETVIFICMYLNVLSLYETVVSICMTQTGPV